jgi:hypothetical protein
MIARLNCVTDEAQRRFKAGRRPGWPLRLASVDTHRMAETGTGSGRSLSGAVPNEDSGDAQPLSMTNGIEP